MGSGTLIQMTTSAAENAYLTKNPDITFFKTIYKKSTFNF